MRAFVQAFGRNAVSPRAFVNYSYCGAPWRQWIDDPLWRQSVLDSFFFWLTLAAARPGGSRFTTRSGGSRFPPTMPFHMFIVLSDSAGLAPAPTDPAQVLT